MQGFCTKFKDRRIVELFENTEIKNKICRKLPRLFQIAGLESQRAGKIGMEVGSIRERIIASLLIYRFGEMNVETEIPITETEIDVKLFGEPISIKTLTGTSLTGLKLMWTVDAESARTFQDKYFPSCDMIFVQINWGGLGGVYYFSKEIQSELFQQIGKQNYIKLPVPGTNPRGVEMHKDALRTLAAHPKIHKIDIKWEKETFQFNAFKRWVDLWEQE